MFMRHISITSGSHRIKIDRAISEIHFLFTTGNRYTVNATDLK